MTDLLGQNSFVQLQFNQICHTDDNAKPNKIGHCIFIYKCGGQPVSIFRFIDNAQGLKIKQIGYKAKNSDGIYHHQAGELHLFCRFKVANRHIDANENHR